MSQYNYLVVKFIRFFFAPSTQILEVTCPSACKIRYLVQGSKWYKGSFLIISLLQLIQSKISYSDTLKTNKHDKKKFKKGCAF